MFCYMLCCVFFVICFVVCFAVCFLLYVLLCVFLLYILLYKFLVLIKLLRKTQSGVVTILVHVFPLPPCPTLLFPGGAGAGINIFCCINF